MLSDLWRTLTLNHPDTGVGLFELQTMTPLRFAGPDVNKFLQGYMTCDVDTLSADRWQPAALCNLQGRVVAFGWARQPTSEQILWLVHQSLVETLRTFLRPYLAFSKTKVDVLDSELLVLGVLGAPVSETARIAPSQDSGRSAGILLVDSAQALQQLADTGHRVDADAWVSVLIEQRIPWFTQAIGGRFLPQMLGITQLGAVDFDKGCYLGQEVVARAQHRGRVKRSLAALTWSGPRPPEPGGDLRDATGREVGTVIQTTSNPDGDRLCLAVLQEKAAAPFKEQDTGLNALS